MSDHSTIEVQLLDKPYRISCPPGEQEVLRVSASYVDKKMREVRGQGRILGLERIAVIVALNLSRELLALQATQRPTLPEDGLERLIARMDQALAAIQTPPA